MIPLPKPGDRRPFVFLSAACRGVVPAKAALAGALGGRARGNPVAWPHDARSSQPTFGQALGRPAATRG